MNIFLSHARKDSQVALQLAKRMEAKGWNVFLPETSIAPGANWAEKIGEALEGSDLMVILLTPGAFQVDWLRKDVEFALGSKKYDGRVFTVFVGPALQVDQEVPWILLKLPHRQVESAKKFGDVVKEIEAFCSNFATDASNA